MHKFLSNSFAFGVFLMVFLPCFTNAQNVTPFVGGGLFGVGGIYAMEYDSLHDRIYIAGSFSSVNGIPAMNIAMLDNGTWKPLGSGTSSFVTTLKFLDGNLYAGGEFEYAGDVHARNIARWDGQNWFSVGNPEAISVRVTLMEVFQNQLYISGNFQEVNNDSTIRYLALWDGTSWKNAGWQRPFSPAGLTTRGDTLWAWGILTSSVSLVRHSTSYLHDTQWDTLPYIKNETDVNSFVFHQGRLLVTTYPNDFIYEWTTNKWKLVEYFGSNIKLKLVSHKEQLYGVSDSFNPSTLIRKINGSQQVQAEIRLLNNKGYVEELNWKEIKNDLYFFGYFSFCNNIPCASLLKLSDGIWSHNDYVAASKMYNGRGEGMALAKAPDSGDWYVGGQFYVAGTEFSQNIARYDGSKWHSMGLGLNGVVTSIAWYKGQIYAVGRFYDSGPQHLTGLARWDGTEWQFCGDAANFPKQLLVIGDKLYLIGTYQVDNAYGVVYTYDGVKWTATGNQNQFFTYPVTSDIVDFQGKLVIATEYYPQGIWQYANGLWTSLDVNPGFQGQIVKLCVINGELYAGARNPNQVLHWNGTLWEDMGYPFNGNNDNRIDGLFEFKGNLLVTTLGGCNLYQNGVWKPSMKLVVDALVRYDSTQYLCAGFFATGEFGNQIVPLNHLALIDCEKPNANILADKDTTCVLEYVHFEANSTGMGMTYEWHFPGASPDTCDEPGCSIKYNSPGVYQVYLKYGNLGGMDSTVYPIVVLPCMVNAQIPGSASNMRIFPNPVQQFLNIQIPGATQLSLQVIDVTGKSFGSCNLPPDTPLDISTLPPGFYFLQVQCAGNRYTGRFIKE